MEHAWLQKLLTPGCSSVREKLKFFAVGEEWLPTGLSGKAAEVLQKSFARIKSAYPVAYYHTLFHLLTCHFCIDRAPEILGVRSHPQLWKIGAQHPGEFWHVLREARERGKEDEKLRYFQIFYENLVNLKQAGILLECRDGEKVCRRILPRAKAAGVGGEMPPVVISDFLSLGQETISLHLERDPVDNSLLIGFHGGPAWIRSCLKLNIHYTGGECDEWEGMEIRMGGMWTIPAEKAENICGIVVSYAKQGR